MINFNSNTLNTKLCLCIIGFTALVHEQETRNLTLHEAQPSAVLNFLFLVRELVLVNPDNALQECCNP